jgi:hypothetical protein
MSVARHYRVLVFVCGAIGFASAIGLACSSNDDPSVPPGFEASPNDFDAHRAAEASSDAPVAVDSSFSGPYCQGIDGAAVILCDDFESVAAPHFGFDNSVIDTDAGSITLTTEAGADHPSTVLDVMLTQVADAGRSAYVIKSLPGPGAPSTFAHYEVELDFRIPATASLPYAALSVLGFPAGAIKEHGFAVYDGNVFGRLAPKDFAVKDDKFLWHHARIVVQRAADGGATSYATTIDIDGTLVDNVGGVGIGDSGVPTVCVGAFDTARTDQGSLRAQFDNVVIRRW